VRKFSKNRGAIQNCRRQKTDMKQVPNWGPTNISCHRRNFSRRCDMAPGNVNYCSQPQMTDLTTSWFKGFYSLSIITVRVRCHQLSCYRDLLTVILSVGSTRYFYFSAGNRRPSLGARSWLCAVRSNDLFLWNRVPCKLIFRRILLRYWPRPQKSEQHLSKPIRWNHKWREVCLFYFAFILARQLQVGQGLLLHEVSRSQTTTHHSR